MPTSSFARTRKLHPLFGRGFDTKLEMRVTNMALRVLLPAGSSKDKKESIVMNTQLHKVGPSRAASRDGATSRRSPTLAEAEAATRLFSLA